MPLQIENAEDTTTLKLQQRCSIEDIPEALPVLRSALSESPNLQLDFSENESVDTAIVQLLISAANSCREFLSEQDDTFQSILERWGLSLALHQTK